MALIRWLGDNDLHSEFDRLSRRLNHLMGHSSKTGFNAALGWGEGLENTGVYPPINIYDDGESLIVQAEVPGIDPKEIDITVTHDTLTLRGERTRQVREGVSYHRREREAGRFHRSLTLPEPVNVEKVIATCTDGVLEIRLPRSESARPRKVAIA